MEVQEEMNDFDKQMVEKLKEAFEQMYKKKLSEAIKRGIEAKRLQKKCQVPLSLHKVSKRADLETCA